MPIPGGPSPIRDDEGHEASERLRDRLHDDDVFRGVTIAVIRYNSGSVKVTDRRSDAGPVLSRQQEHPTL